jgi:hypothetical protein
MTTEPPEGKNHGAEEEDGILEDKGLDDLDLEALLADDSPKEKEPAAAGAEEVGSGNVRREELGEADLLDDDIELLDEESAGSDAGKAPVQPGKVPSSALPEEISVEDLLAEEMSPEEDSGLREMSAEEDSAITEISAEEDSAMKEAPPVDDEATSVLAAEEAEKKEEAPAEEAPEKAGKLGKKKLGKPLKKFTKKEKGKKEEKPARKEKEAEPEPVGAGTGGEDVGRGRPGARGSLTFVCSECYEEFLLPPNFSQEMVSCPECLHVGKRPDADFLRSVKMHKAGERKFLAAAVVCGAILLIVILALFWVISPYSVAGGKLDTTIVYGLAGGAVVLTAILVWLILRFEGNRWEVYF